MPMKKILLIVLFPLFLVITGCNVGPDYKAPELTVSDAWVGDTAAGEPNLVQWWMQFNDPNLTLLIERAIESNLDMKLAKMRIRQARAVLAGSQAGLWPFLDTSGSYSRNRSSNGQEADLYRAGLDAAWELDIFGGTRRDIEAAAADLTAVEEDSRDIQISLAAEIAFNYINLRGFQQKILISRQNLQAQQRSAELTRKRSAAGFVGALDVANAEALAATTQSLIPTQESAAQQSIYTLSILLGSGPATMMNELSPVSSIPNVSLSIPAGVPSDLLRRRPDIRRAEALIHSATARIGSATSDLFPKFMISGALGFQNERFDSLANWNNRIWSIGPSASWNIFDAGRVQSNIEVQKSIQEQALLSYQKTVLTAIGDVENAMIALTKEQQRLQSLQNAVNANQKAVELAMLLYTQGETGFLNVLDAQRALLVSQEARVNSTAAISTNLVALYKALGGGWDESQTSGIHIMSF